MNSIMIITPYKYEDLWVFDDAAANLVREPFVSGADEMIDLLVESIPNADTGFSLLFSASPFPGYQAHLTWSREEHGGNWYFWADRQREGWLCPALFAYFPIAPKDIYVQAKPKKSDRR